jgi:predicted enzyme related to lactoylglutathione lyase
MTDSSTQGIKTVLHPVSDLGSAKQLYAALLGVPPQTDASYYVGFEAAGQHIGLVPAGGPQGMTSPVAYWHVTDLEARLADVTAAGATVKEPAHDVGGVPLGCHGHRPRWQCPRAVAGSMRGFVRRMEVLRNG